MSFIQATDNSNPVKSVEEGNKTETKVVAKVVADNEAERNTRKGKIASSNGSACDYAI